MALISGPASFDGSFCSGVHALIVRAQGSRLAPGRRSVRIILAVGRP